MTLEHTWKLCSRSLILENPLCKICNCEETQAVHHIIGKKNRYLMFDDINLIPVCSTCHNKFHAQHRYSKTWGVFEIFEILERLKGLEGIQYLFNHKHNMKSWTDTELKSLCNGFNKRIKEAR